MHRPRGACVLRGHYASIAHGSFRARVVSKDRAGARAYDTPYNTHHNTPLGAIFQRRFISKPREACMHNENGGVGNISSKYFHRRIARCLVHPPLFRENQPINSSDGGVLSCVLPITGDRSKYFSRTHDIPKNLCNTLFLLSIFGPDYCAPP
ncbi:unnamed protein product [Laminaria digitata]